MRIAHVNSTHEAIERLQWQCWQSSLNMHMSSSLGWTYYGSENYSARAHCGKQNRPIPEEGLVDKCW